MSNSCRKAFSDTILELAKSDSSIQVLCTDSRGSALLNEYAEKLPEQFVEVGIAEQNCLGMAAGLANVGMKPFAVGPASFYTARSAEQLKVDIAYSNSNVKVIGISGGVSYGALGATHHSIQDIAFTRAIHNLSVLLPCDAAQTAAMTRVLAEYKGPVYMRFGRGSVPDVYEKTPEFTIGKANILRQGANAAIIAAGEMVYPSIKAADLLLKKGIEVKVIDMCSIKPLDEEAVLDAAKTGFVITVEEHSVYGGLGAAVAEVIVQKTEARMKIMGIPDTHVVTGSSQEVFDYYSLTPAGIAKNALAMIEGKK